MPIRQISKTTRRRVLHPPGGPAVSGPLPGMTPPPANLNPPLMYQIRIKGHLGLQWSDWFDCLTITQTEDGDTLLTGPVLDQAALHGLLTKVRDLGLPLVSVNRLDPGQSGAPKP